MAEPLVAEKVGFGPHTAKGGTCACPYCAGRSSMLVATTDINRQTTDREFFYFQCSQCGLVFMDPIPADMGPYYAGGYQPIPDSLSELRAIAAEEKYRLDAILKHKSGGSLLEIGPWRGVFCVNAKDAGFRVSAIEMDDRCVAFLNQTVGIRAIQSFNPAATLRDLEERFDVIALWHSLEHLPNPWEVVQIAAKRLNPGGLLLIAIPNIESFEFSILRDQWRHLDTPRHLYFYPIASLIALCSENGLAQLDVTTADHVSEMLARDTWHNWANRKSNHPFVRRVLIRTVSTFARFRESGMKDAGSGLTAIFQLQESAKPLG